ncbi:MAG: hypothetical protein ABI560_00190 [Myxococcales bacterium]
MTMALIGLLLVSACSSAGGRRQSVDGASVDGAMDASSPDQCADRPGADQSISEGGDDRATVSDTAVPLDVTPAIDALVPVDADGPGIPADDGSGADGAVGNACRPACIEEVFGPCSEPKAGTCVNTGKQVCFSNGVILATTLLDGGAGKPFAMVTLLKPDGTMCGYYTNAVGADGNVYLVYYDPSGGEVARQQRVVADAAGGDLLYTCGGHTYTVTSAQLQAPECHHLQPRDCPMGMCP